MIDDEVRGHKGIHLGRVPAEVCHRVAHDRKVDDRGHPGEVLEHDPRRHEGDLGLGGDTGAPGCQGIDVGRLDDPATGVAEDVLQEDLERDRSAGQIDSVADRGKGDIVREACPKAPPSIERIRDRHASSIAAVGTLVGWKSTPSRARSGSAGDEGLGRIRGS